MALILFIHNLGEYVLRKNLKQNKRSIPNQLGKNTNNPSLRWAFEQLRDVRVVTLKFKNDWVREIKGITKAAKTVIEMFGSDAMRIYGYS
ncbi:MAG: hypothetical protein HOE90_05240 [Bacteriovoracaceae bacterium]|nr:hypothetical protein [Bacteriovoracaceae bacterium]